MTRHERDQTWQHIFDMYMSLLSRNEYTYGTLVYEIKEAGLGISDVSAENLAQEIVDVKNQLVTTAVNFIRDYNGVVRHPIRSIIRGKGHSLDVSVDTTAMRVIITQAMIDTHANTAANYQFLNEIKDGSEDSSAAQYSTHETPEIPKIWNKPIWINAVTPFLFAHRDVVQHIKAYLLTQKDGIPERIRRDTANEYENLWTNRFEVGRHLIVELENSGILTNTHPYIRNLNHVIHIARGMFFGRPASQATADNWPVLFEAAAGDLYNVLMFWVILRNCLMPQQSHHDSESEKNGDAQHSSPETPEIPELAAMPVWENAVIPFERAHARAMEANMLCSALQLAKDAPEVPEWMQENAKRLFTNRLSEQADAIRHLILELEHSGILDNPHPYVAHLRLVTRDARSLFFGEPQYESDRVSWGIRCDSAALDMHMIIEFWTVLSRCMHPPHETEHGPMTG